MNREFYHIMSKKIDNLILVHFEIHVRSKANGKRTVQKVKKKFIQNAYKKLIFFPELQELTENHQEFIRLQRYVNLYKNMDSFGMLYVVELPERIANLYLNAVLIQFSKIFIWKKLKKKVKNLKINLLILIYYWKHQRLLLHGVQKEYRVFVFAPYSKRGF